MTSPTIGRCSFAALGTTAELLTFPDDALGPATEMLVDHLRALDGACSRFRPDSELSAVNRSSGHWVEVGPLLREAVAVALTAAAQTGGAVDPTVGRALRVLGYDRDFALVAPEGPALVARFEPVAGWQRVELDGPRRRLRVPPGVELDLGATAKAFAADRAARDICRATGASVLVSLGGDLAIDGPPGPGLWPVHVTDDHRGALCEQGQTVVVEAGGLATSSTTTRGWARGGARLHHIVDPVTGGPAAGPWRTASVTAATCTDANTAATAALVKGTTAVAWLESTGLPARLVDYDGRSTAVNGWPAAALGGLG